MLKREHVKRKTYLTRDAWRSDVLDYIERFYNSKTPARILRRAVSGRVRTPSGTIRLVGAYESGGDSQALTQAQFADLAGLHVNRVRHYEAGVAQPSLEGLKKIALTLHSRSMTSFDADERRPKGERLALLFEAVSGLPDDEQRIVQAVLDGLVVENRARQLAGQHAASSRS